MNETVPPPKPSQYYFCVSVTPKTLAMSIFQSKGIQSLYKLQIDKGSRKQTSEITRRNLHEQALKGFYKSQKCYFTLSNYTNLRPYQMKVIFSQISSSTSQQQKLFSYKFSTFSIVKNFLENGVRRSTHVVTIDYETQFYIDLYIQSSKTRLQQKVKLDDSLQTLRKRYVQESEHQSDVFMEKTFMNDSFYEKNSDANKMSLRQFYSPLKSRMKNFENLKRINNLNHSFTSPVTKLPLLENILEADQKKSKRRNLITNNGIEDSRSERVNHSKSKHTTRSKNFNNENFLRNEKKSFKKSPSTKLSMGDFGQPAKSERKPQKEKNSTLRVFKKPSIQSSEQFNIHISQLSKSQPPSKDKIQLKENNDKEAYLQLIQHAGKLSVDEVQYKFKKNFWFLLFVLFIIFMVLSKAFDVANLEKNKDIVRGKRQKVKQKTMKLNKAKEDLRSKVKVKNSQVKKQSHKQKQSQLNKFKSTLKSF